MGLGGKEVRWVWEGRREGGKMGLGGKEGRR